MAWWCSILRLQMQGGEDCNRCQPMSSLVPTVCLSCTREREVSRRNVLSSSLGKTADILIAEAIIWSDKLAHILRLVFIHQRLLQISKSLPNQNLFLLFCGCAFNTLFPLKWYGQNVRGYRGKATRTEYWVTYNTKEPQTKLPPFHLFQPCRIFWHRTSLLSPYFIPHLAHNPCTLIICPPSTHFSFVSHPWKPITSRKS